ncbi:hypothetical protein BGZ67_006469 [Mortierella alpina]|nr:hypothetical protein BGZ67_006469 [Mortierella alpina]
MVQILQAKALFDCHGDEDSELTFLEGDILTDVRVTSEDGWLHGRLERTGEEGLFPDNYVELIHMAIDPYADCLACFRAATQFACEYRRVYTYTTSIENPDINNGSQEQPGSRNNR